MAEAFYRLCVASSVIMVSVLELNFEYLFQIFFKLDLQHQITMILSSLQHVSVGVYVCVLKCFRDLEA